MVFESTPRYWKPPGKVVFVLGKRMRSLVPIEGMVFESTPRYWKPPGKVVFVLGKRMRSLVPTKGMVFESTPRCESQTRVRQALVSLAWRTAVDIFPKMEEFLR